MKTKYTLLFLLVVALALGITACHKDTQIEPKAPKVTEPDVSFTATTANFSWKVSFPGKVSSVVKLSRHADMSEAISYGDDKPTSHKDFDVEITGLSPETKYYYCFEAWNPNLDFRSEVKSFTTLTVSKPSVTTSTATNISWTTATVGGNVINDGNDEVTERGVCCGTSHNPDMSSGFSHIVATSAGTGEYTCSITGLSPSTKYYVRAYAMNSEGTAYGDELSFTTNSLSIPTVTTSQAAEVGYNKATVGGTVTDDGGATVTERGVYWGTANPPTTKKVIGSGLGDFNGQLTGLSENTKYYYVAYAVNSMGESKDEVKDFITTSIPTYTISVSASPSNGGMVTGGGTYQQGQSCTVSATANTNYFFTNWTENGNVVTTQASYTFTVTGNRSLAAHFTAIPTGAINGVFSVSSTKKVYFSQGNLQYRASDGRWRFAEHQYDYIGSNNTNISSSYSNYIDSFGWGTSGWNSGAVCYQPWSTSDNSSDYYPGGSYTNDLTGSYANADWGVYNKIYNGGNTAGQWRTLTKDEWVYVFQSRSNASSKYGHGKVNGVCGMILLPDNWTLPSGLSFTAGNSSWANSYTIAQWAMMEANGAVFLPAAGRRYGNPGIGISVECVGSQGYYWSASYGTIYCAYIVDFESGYLNSSVFTNREYGGSVRLVAPAE